MERMKEIYDEQDLKKLKEAGATEEEINLARKLIPENVKRRKREEKISEVVAARGRDDVEDTKNAQLTTVESAQSVEVSAANAHAANARQHRKQGHASFRRVSRTSTARILKNYRKHRGHDYISKSNSLSVSANKHISVSGLENVSVPELTDPKDLNKTYAELLTLATVMQTILEKEKEAMEATTQEHKKAVNMRSERRSNQMKQGVNSTLHGMTNLGLGAGNVLTENIGRGVVRGTYAISDTVGGVINMTGAALGSVNDSIENFMEEKQIADQQESISQTIHSKEDVAMHIAVVKEALARQQR